MEHGGPWRSETFCKEIRGCRFVAQKTVSETSKATDGTWMSQEVRING